MCPYLGPVTCDHALPIPPWRTPKERMRGMLHVFPSLLKKKVKPAIADRGFMGLYIISLRKQPTFPDMPFPGWRRKVFSLATTSAVCQQALHFEWHAKPAALEHTSVGKWQGITTPLPRSRFLSCAASAWLFKFTVTIYIHQLKTLFAGWNISCNALAISLLAEFSKKINGQVVEWEKSSETAMNIIYNHRQQRFSLDNRALGIHHLHRSELKGFE